MDKRDFNAADILTAVQTINHHVKDLQKLERYIDFCFVSANCSDEQVQLMRRQVDDTGRKYVSVNLNGKLYHYPSDELFAEHPDFPIEQFTSGASKKKIFDFEKAEVDDAITTIRNFIFPER